MGQIALKKKKSQNIYKIMEKIIKLYKLRMANIENENFNIKA